MTGEVSIITLVEAILSSNTSTSWDTSRGDTRVCSGCRGYTSPDWGKNTSGMIKCEAGGAGQISDSQLEMSVTSPHHTLAEVPWLLLPAAGNSEPGKLQINMDSGFKCNFILIQSAKSYFSKILNAKNKNISYCSMVHLRTKMFPHDMTIQFTASGDLLCSFISPQLYNWRNVLRH